MPITADDVQGMVSHWLGCPPNGYLGSPYGAPVDELLQSPQHGPAADALMTKLRADVPVIAQLDGQAVAVMAEPDGPDRTLLTIEVAGSRIPIDTTTS